MKPGSSLYNALELTAPKTIIRPFRWSGRNSAKARRVAAKRLQIHLGEVIREFANAKHVVVAHSHGGNIALESIDSRLAAKLVGLVCLATPVLVQRKMDRDPFAAFAIKWCPVPSAFFLGAFVPYLFGFGAGPQMTGALVASLGSLFFIRHISRREAMSYLSSKVAIKSEKTIFIRSIGDEASLIIGASSLVSLALEKLVLGPMSALYKLAATFDQFRSRTFETARSCARVAAICGGVCVIVTSALYLAYMPERKITSMDFWSNAVLFSIFFSAFSIFVIFFRIGNLALIVIIGYYAVVFLPIALIIIALLSALSLGPEMALQIAANRVTAEVTPLGSWQVSHLGSASSDGSERLQHSRVYEDADALSLIQTWIRERLR